VNPLRRLALWILRHDAKTLGLYLLDEVEHEGIWNCAKEIGYRSGHSHGLVQGRAEGRSETIAKMTQPRDRRTGRYLRLRVR